jgi:hypothetical protein
LAVLQGSSAISMALGRMLRLRLRPLRQIKDFVERGVSDVVEAMLRFD